MRDGDVQMVVFSWRLRLRLFQQYHPKPRCFRVTRKENLMVNVERRNESRCGGDVEYERVDVRYSPRIPSADVVRRSYPWTMKGKVTRSLSNASKQKAGKEEGREKKKERG
jgi:hypothetical protein